MAGGPAPIYVVCSPSPRVGKTWWRAVSPSTTSPTAGSVAAYDLSDESLQLIDYLPHHAAAADIADIRGQMALFDGLIADDEMPKVIDVGHRAFWRFFAVVHRIGFFDEARRRGIEPVILFMADADPRTERACTLLRFSFPDLALLPVRNLAVMRGHAEVLSCAGEASAPDASADETSFSCAAAGDRRIAVVAAGPRRSSGLLFCRFPKVCAGRRPVVVESAAIELVRFIRQVHAQLREIELGLVNEQAFAGLQ